MCTLLGPFEKGRNFLASELHRSLFFFEKHNIPRVRVDQLLAIQRAIESK